MAHSEPVERAHAEPGCGRAPARSSTGLARIEARDLLGPQGELLISHEGRVYRLRITQNRRLLLTA